MNRLALGLVLFLGACTVSPPRQTPILPAAIDRDCAPWDGAAFTVTIPWEGGGVVDISIFRAPDIPRPTRFSFPDPDLRVGSASYRAEGGPAEILTGVVTLRPVRPGVPAEGEMRLTSQMGAVYEASFKADWGTLRVFCG